MARNRRRGNRRNPSETEEPQSSSGAAFVGGLNRAGSVDDYMLGFANLTRSFEYNASRTSIGRRPPFFMRNCFPQISFYEGFSASAAPSDGVNTDLEAATDTDATVGAALYPVTPYAIEFEQVVWPVVQNILRGGLGQRTAVAFSDFVRYIAMTQKVYCHLRDAVTLNVLAFHYDWSKVFPFSDVVPKEIKGWARLLNCDDAGMAQYWYPLMQRLESRIMFPGWLHETRNALKPLLSVDLAPELWIPRFTFLTAFANIQTDCQDLLSYIEVELGDTEAVLKSFLPFSLAEMNPWQFDEPAADIMRWNGFVNEGITNYTTFGTGGVDSDSVLNFTGEVDDGTISPSATSLPVKWLCQTEAPVWAGLKYGGIFMTITNTTLDEHVQITPHQTANVGIVEDYEALGPNNMIRQFVGSGDIASRDLSWLRALRFAGARNDSIDGGYMLPGHILGSVEGEGVIRLVELQCLADFSFQALQQLNVVTLGRSLREVQRTLKQLIYSNA